MTTAAIYCRISKDAELRGLGVARQERECRALAERKGWEVVEVYVDNDLSAASMKRPRPAYRRMLDDVRAGKAEAIIARHDDRLHRHPRELEDFMDFVDETGATVLLLDGLRDFTSARGRADARNEATRSKYESERKGERLRLMHEELAAQGRFSGGPAPYGYRSMGDGRLEVVPEEAAVIRGAAERVLAGQTLYTVCADLNARGVPGRKGGGWRTPTLKKVLTEPSVAGRRVFRKEDLGPAGWAAILDEVTWRRLRTTLLSGGGTGRGRPPAYLLSGGLARCGACGGRLHTQRRTNGRRQYVCGVGPDKPEGSGCVSVAAEPLEAEVVGQVLAVLDTPELARALVNEEDQAPDDLAERIAALEARLLEIGDDYDGGIITRAEYLHRRERRAAELEAARREASRVVRHAALEPYAGKEGALGEAWPTLPLDQQRAVLAAVLDQVVVNRRERPGGRFDPARVNVVWRV
jgi:site-specific DNA recombinase